MKRLLTPLLITVMLGLGCSTNKFIKKCEGGNLKYNKLEVLAEASGDPKLLKIDGSYYWTCEDGSIIDFDKGKLEYIEDQGSKTIRVSDEKIVSEYTWSSDGNFYIHIGLRHIPK